MSARIRTVSERCQIPAATLRMWERRYGFPAPQRTGGNYREYSEDDIAQILRVKTLLATGLVASEAIAQVRLHGAAHLSQEAVKQLRSSFLEAAQRMAERSLEEIAQLARKGLEAWDFCELFALPLLRALSSEALDIAREHLASSVLRQQMREALYQLSSPAQSKVVILACPEGEEHEGGLIAIAIRLRVLGQRVVLLGANTPANAVAAACVGTHVDAIGLSFVEPRDEAFVKDFLTTVIAACPGVPVFAGGPFSRKHLRTVFAAGAQFAESADELLAACL